MQLIQTQKNIKQQLGKQGLMIVFLIRNPALILEANKVDGDGGGISENKWASKPLEEKNVKNFSNWIIIIIYLPKCSIRT